MRFSKRSGYVRSTESDRDTIPEQQPTGGELVDRQRGLDMVDLHTRERIDFFEAAYEAVPESARLKAAKIVAQIEKEQKRRYAYGLLKYSSLTINDEIEEPRTN